MAFSLVVKPLTVEFLRDLFLAEFFFIYVNDIYFAISCKFIFYADDSALLASCNDIKIVEPT